GQDSQERPGRKPGPRPGLSISLQRPHIRDPVYRYLVPEFDKCPRSRAGFSSSTGRRCAFAKRSCRTPVTCHESFTPGESVLTVNWLFLISRMTAALASCQQELAGSGSRD